LKIIKNRQNQKSDKMWKSRKWKIIKSDKMEKWKSDKNSEKKGGTRKRPKCHLNGQNRHFAKSEPPGWALFEFQGVPRDPVLRPKIDPLFLNVKFDHVFTFWSFSISPFCAFYDFNKCDKLHISWIDPFFAITHKALLRVHKREEELCVVVLPSLMLFIRLLSVC